MIHWNKMPFVRLLIPLLVGICFSFVTAPVYGKNFIGIITCLVLLICIHYYFTKHSIRWLFGIVLFALLFYVGYDLACMKNEYLNKQHFCHFISKKNVVIAKITQPVVIKTRSVQIIADVQAVSIDRRWKSTFGNALFYIQKDSNAEYLQYGDRILLNVYFNEAETPSNPNTFNYKRYLANKQIYHQAYAAKEQWVFLSHNTSFSIYAFANHIRDKLLNMLQDKGVEGEAFNVASALIIGKDDLISKEITRCYADSGTIHILSVSGLHVGIIYILINYLLFYLNRTQRKRVIKAVILIISIWFYALITGLSPPVLRSATMFTFIIIGKEIDRDNNIINHLAASAFILICTNPLFITDVGFQLSYSALLGIILLQKHIYSLWQTRYWLLNQCLLLTSVSMAAQAFALPLSIYYFHQVPTYFILANLIAIPLSSLALYAGVATWLTYPIPFISTFCAEITNYSILIMNKMLFFISKLSYSKITDVSLTSLELTTILICICLIIVFIYQKNVRFLIYSLICILILMAELTFRNYTQLTQKTLIVYQIPKSTSINIINGKESYLIADTSLMEKNNSVIQNNWISSGIRKKTTISLSNDYKDTFIVKHLNIIGYNKKLIAILYDTTNEELDYKERIYVDYLIITKSYRMTARKLLSTFNPKQIIIDSSVPIKESEILLKEYKQYKIPIYSVNVSGAFIATI